MGCRMGDLRNKEVINVKDGSRVGFVSDVELDTKTAGLTALVVYGRLRLFGILGREPDTVIPWKSIVLIGDDTVLVDHMEAQALENKGMIQKIMDKLCI